MKIRTQLIAGIVVFALLLVVISGLVISTDKRVENLVTQEETANNIALEVGELGYLSNDYILYREPQQVDRWNAKFASISQNIAGLSVDQPDQQAIVGTLAANLKNSKSIFDDIAASPSQAGEPGTAFIQLSWSRMAVQNQGMIFDASRLATLIRGQADELRQFRLELIFALMGAFIALLLSSYLLFYRRALRSIANLQEGATIVGSGDFSHTIVADSNDEIGDLAHSFNKMAANLLQVSARKADLEAEVTERKRAEAGLAQKNEELGTMNEELTAAHEDLVHANAQLAAKEKELVGKNDNLRALNEEITSAHEELQQNLDELSRTQGELLTSEERFRNLFEKMTEGFAVHEIICDDNGKPVDYRFLDLNPAFEQLTGLRRSEVIGRTVNEVLPGVGQDWIDRYGSVALTGTPVHFDNYSEPLGRYYDVFSYSPAPLQFAVLFSDITIRKNAEANQNLMEEVLRILNRGGDLHTMIGEILAGIKKSTGFDAVGLRLREGEDYPYYEQSGFSDDFLRKENFLCARSTDRSIILTEEGKPVFVCTCGSVICGKTDPSMPCFTTGGSFWTNKSSDLLSLPPVDDPRTNPRNTCIHDGFQSFALVPIRSGKEIFGLIQLNDRREGRFSPDMIRFFETLGDNIGLALQRKQTEDALYESEGKLKTVFSILPVGVSIVNNDLNVTDANPTLERILGLSKEHLIKGDFGKRKYLRPDGKPMPVSEFPSTRAIRDQVTVSDVEIHILREDGSEVWENVSSAPLPGSGAVIVTSDITKRKYDEDILRLSTEIFRISASSSDLPFILKAYANLFQHYLGCDSVGIRLLDENGNIPYHASIGFPDDFYRSESPLSIKTDPCMCINVITGTTDPSLPFYTAGGSFFINGTTKFLSTVSDEDKSKTRNVCNQAGYESVALVPIRKGDTILGLIHLADHREGMVPVRAVNIVESVAPTVGSSILRIRAETDLRETRDHLENLITYANAPIIVWDTEFRISRFNHAFERLTGRPAHLTLGQPISILFPDNQRTELMAMIRRTLTGERWEAVEIPIAHADGGIKMVLWNSATLYEADGKTVSSVIAQGQDITDRKKAEEALRETSEYLDNLITYANAPIIVWDPTFHITRFNHAAEWLTGRSAEEMIGHRLETLFPGETLFDSVRRIKSASLGERMETVEIPIRHTSGEVKTVLWNSAIIFGSDGKTIASTIAQGQDISGRKKAERELMIRNEELNEANNELSAIHEELRHANEDLNRKNEELGSIQEELQQNVDELNRSEEVLRQSESELKEALEEKEILLSEIHHRVKNNLTAFISLLSLEGSYQDSIEGRNLKKDLQNRARSMALIHETLYRTKKYSTVDMGVYLATLIEQIAASYSSAKTISTIVEADGTTIDIARATPCGLIINELITNSFKYAFPESFDCTTMRQEPCTIRVSLKKEEGMFILSVSDNGIGLPESVDIGTTQSLGLKLVNFLAKHQLRAKIEIHVLEGTEFVIFFSDTIK